MKVILIPARLRLAAALLFICVPLAAFETALVSRAPWWRLPYRSIEIWSLAVLLFMIPVSVWIMRGKALARRILEVFFALWLLLSAWVAIRVHHPGLGFFTLLLLAVFSTFVLWIRYELGRSFFDPRMRWYEGLPRPLPGIVCHVSWGDRDVECKVGRLDREGAFVFGSTGELPGPLNSLRTDVQSELTFSFRELSVRCPGLPMRVLDQDRGAGFQFHELAPDLRKQLGDFIEILRGEGYVL